MDFLASYANLDKFQSLPAGICLSLEDAADQILKSADNESRIRAALAAGKYLSNIALATENKEQAMDLARILVDRLLLPNETESDSETSTLMAEVGITCLQLLSSTWSCNLDNAALLKLAAFTDPRDPWTTEEAAIVASHLLKTELDVEKLAAFIAGPVLQEFLKPLFAKSSSRVTESGRPDHYLLAAGSTQQHKKTSIWKTTFPSAIAVVRWAVEVSEISLLQQQWPLFTPVLLALVEDESAAVKTKGLDILASFARKCPPEVLHTTGIVRVFEDATFPILLYLPSLTPEDESVNLLRPAYKVLFALAETYHSPQNPERRRLLDKLLREGIFAAYSHSSQYARLVQTLMESMELAIKCLGIYSAKHLKNILSIISAVMEDPFATAYPPAVLATVKALQATISTCWPRLQEGTNFEQIIRSLSLCWLSFYDTVETSSTNSESETAISRALIQASRMLGAVWNEGHTRLPTGLSEVLEKDTRLSQLFPTLSE